MKYLVHLSMPIRNGIGGDNLRGEPRVERHILASLLSCNKEVYTTDWPVETWCSGVLPNTLHRYSELKDIKNTSYIAYSAPSHSMVVRDAENYILLMFNTPHQNPKNDILSLMKSTGGRVMIVSPFINNLNTMRNDYGTENVVLIEGPAVPNISKRNNEQGLEYLLWAYRSFYNNATNCSREVHTLFDWCRSKMVSNDILKVAVIVGDYPSVNLSKEDLYKWFWGLECSSPLKSLKDRVELFWDINWDVVMDIHRRTKLVISPGLSAGGPPYEAAINGTPVIFSNQYSPYKFEGMLTANNGVSPDFISKLEMLYSNKDLYNHYSDLYYNYVSTHATYSAWVNRIESEIKTRGWE